MNTHKNSLKNSPEYFERKPQKDKPSSLVQNLSQSCKNKLKKLALLGTLAFPQAPLSASEIQAEMLGYNINYELKAGEWFTAPPLTADVRLGNLNEGIDTTKESILALSHTNWYLTEADFTNIIFPEGVKELLFHKAVHQNTGEEIYTIASENSDQLYIDAINAGMPEPHADALAEIVHAKETVSQENSQENPQEKIYVGLTATPEKFTKELTGRYLYQTPNPKVPHGKNTLSFLFQSTAPEMTSETHTVENSVGETLDSLLSQKSVHKSHAVTWTDVSILTPAECQDFYQTECEELDGYKNGIMYSIPLGNGDLVYSENTLNLQTLEIENSIRENYPQFVRTGLYSLTPNPAFDAFCTDASCVDFREKPFYRNIFLGYQKEYTLHTAGDSHLVSLEPERRVQEIIIEGGVSPSLSKSVSEVPLNTVFTFANGELANQGLSALPENALYKNQIQRFTQNTWSPYISLAPREGESDEFSLENHQIFTSALDTPSGMFVFQPRKSNEPQHIFSFGTQENIHNLEEALLQSLWKAQVYDMVGGKEVLTPAQWSSLFPRSSQDLFFIPEDIETKISDLSVSDDLKNALRLALTHKAYQKNTSGTVSRTHFISYQGLFAQDTVLTPQVTGDINTTVSHQVSSLEEADQNSTAFAKEGRHTGKDLMAQDEVDTTLVFNPETKQLSQKITARSQDVHRILDSQVQKTSIRPYNKDIYTKKEIMCFLNVLDTLVKEGISEEEARKGINRAYGLPEDSPALENNPEAKDNVLLTNRAIEYFLAKEGVEGFATVEFFISEWVKTPAENFIYTPSYKKFFGEQEVFMEYAYFREIRNLNLTFEEKLKCVETMKSVAQLYQRERENLSYLLKIWDIYTGNIKKYIETTGEGRTWWWTYAYKYHEDYTEKRAVGKFDIYLTNGDTVRMQETSTSPISDLRKYLSTLNINRYLFVPHDESPVSHEEYIRTVLARIDADPNFYQYHRVLRGTIYNTGNESIDGHIPIEPEEFTYEPDEDGLFDYRITDKGMSFDGNSHQYYTEYYPELTINTATQYLEINRESENIPLINPYTLEFNEYLRTVVTEPIAPGTHVIDTTDLKLLFDVETFVPRDENLIPLQVLSIYLDEFAPIPAISE
jgi:hypothetical protein